VFDQINKDGPKTEDNWKTLTPYEIGTKRWY